MMSKPNRNYLLTVVIISLLTVPERVDASNDQPENTPNIMLTAEEGETQIIKQGNVLVKLFFPEHYGTENIAQEAKVKVLLVNKHEKKQIEVDSQNLFLRPVSLASKTNSKVYVLIQNIFFDEHHKASVIAHVYEIDEDSLNIYELAALRIEGLSVAKKYSLSLDRAGRCNLYRHEENNVIRINENETAIKVNLGPIEGHYIVRD